MASWYATATNEGPTSDRCGSDWNIVIDGRLSRASACELVAEHFKKYSKFKNQQYCGFRIAKGTRWACNESPSYHTTWGATNDL